MLFNSPEFIILYLPIVLTLYYGCAKYVGPHGAKYFLIFASLVFYSYWDIHNLPVLLCSTVINYFFAYLIFCSFGRMKKYWLIAGIVFDLSFLGYFKYTGFILDNISSLLDISMATPQITLPLGISFFTFTQLAYLVDAYRSETGKYSRSDYALFVTIFPHLIAGPILHHKNMIPQFSRPQNYQVNYENLCQGIFWFSSGLFKKVLLADTLSKYVNYCYGNIELLSTFDAWMATLSYTLQLYFDFSGYSEMAIGLGLMLNFHLPLNFNSPYQSASMIDFWRRWHMTLSNFLKNYLYIPLGGNRTGHHLRNIFLTMLLGGLWHGAGWTFIIWGGLHGMFICINHCWRKLPVQLPFLCNWFLTFSAVNFAWIFFRADNIGQAWQMLQIMAGMPLSGESIHYFGRTDIGCVSLCAMLCFLGPNIAEISKRFFRVNWFWLAVCMILFFIALRHARKLSEFLYFQF